MIIGVDPHKNSHTATVLDRATNAPASSLRIEANLPGYRELLRWAAALPERRWAIENARGLGRHLAQWLVARGETVVDVPTTATARVRELSRGGRRKTDVLDASAAASVVAQPTRSARTVAGMSDHRALLPEHVLGRRRGGQAGRLVRVSLDDPHQPYQSIGDSTNPEKRVRN